MLKPWGVIGWRNWPSGNRRWLGMAVQLIRGMEDLVASGSQLIWTVAHHTWRRWYNRGLTPCRRLLEAWFGIGKCYQVWAADGARAARIRPVRGERLYWQLFVNAGWISWDYPWNLWVTLHHIWQGLSDRSFPMVAFVLIRLISVCMCLFTWRGRSLVGLLFIEGLPPHPLPSTYGSD